MGRGIVILCTVIFTTFMLFIPLLGLLVIPLWLLAWVFSIYDGYRTARDWNQAHGIIS